MTTTAIDGRLVAGVDVGGTKVSVVVTDARDAVLHEQVAPVEPPVLVAQVAGMVDRARRELGRELAAVGVAIPGHVDPDTGDVRIHPHWQLNRKHAELHGCWGSDFSHFYRGVHLAAKHGGRVPWREMIGARYGLAEAGEALGAVERREVTKAVIVPR